MNEEFQYLKSDAQRVGRLAPLPRVSRVTHLVPSGRKVSALTFVDYTARNTVPTVFLHGMGLNAHTFDPTILAFQEHAVSIDLPGHGQSEWRPDADYSPNSIAEDVAAMITKLIDGPFHLVGHSLGGLTAAAIAPLLMDRLQHLVLIDVTPGISPQADAAQVTEFMTGQRVFTSIDEIVDRAIRFHIGTDRVALTRGVALNTRKRPDGTYEWAHHLAHVNPTFSPTAASLDPRPFEGLWNALAPFGDRVTGIRGSHGFVTEALQKEWSARLPRSEMHTIEAGHNVHEHAPVELAHSMRVLTRE